MCDHDFVLSSRVGGSGDMLIPPRPPRNFFNRNYVVVFASAIGNTLIREAVAQRDMLGASNVSGLANVSEVGALPPPTSFTSNCQLQGRKHGHIRYKDFVKAMTDTSLARGRGSDGGGSNRGGRSRQKGGRAERRRGSSADHIERLVDRLKAVRKSNVQNDHKKV